MQNLRDLDINEIKTLVAEAREPTYRAGQIFKWSQSGARSFDDMTDIPKNLKAFLSERVTLRAPEMLKCQTASDGTKKYLWGFNDGNCVETVLMNYQHGYSVCVSTQVGCRMGCVFCASHEGGKIRDLTPGEMIEQVLFAGLDMGVRISNIVLMGTGEPLDNMSSVLKFITLANDEKGLGIGGRHISLSTCGLVDRIRELEKLNLQITLSVSLHAPTNELRSQIMPVNKRWPIEELLDACRSYSDSTGRRISYEYALIRGFNDSAQSAVQLADRLRGSLSHVNLIRLNKIDGSALKPSTAEDTKRFLDTLNKRGVNATVRRRLGFDIDASCGQLRGRYRQAEGM